MPRGFHKDIQATAAAGFHDRRSFISLPKLTPHTDGQAQEHLVLYGADKGPMREKIFARNRIENHSAVPKCWNCGAVCYEHSEYDRGEWHHVESGPGERCDCAANGVVSCRECHSERHVQTQFRKANV